MEPQPAPQANHRPASGGELVNANCLVQGCFVSSLFRIRRSSMKFKAVMVQSTLPNIIITILSIEAGSSPAWLLALLIPPSLDFSMKYNPNRAPALLPF